jgi:hypothetical protein
MSGYVAWINAQADEGFLAHGNQANENRADADGANDAWRNANRSQPQDQQAHPGGKSAGDAFALENLLQEFPAHNFPASSTRSEPEQPRAIQQDDPAPESQLQEDPLDRNPDLWLYRRRTVKLLRRYMRFSIETGRLPSFIGREFFRTRVTSYSSVTFEDRVIFVRDVEKCLHRLHEWDQQMVARVILQEHAYDDAARFLHCSAKTIQRRVPEVLDLLSESFLEAKLMDPVAEK